jgi:hypothetical protein
MALRTPSETMDDVLSADVLGRLPRDPSPRQIAEVVGQIRAGQFMAVRLGLSANFLVHIASEDPNDTQALWQSALAVWERSGSPKITGAVLAAALVEQFPNYEGLLANLKIGMEDVERGIRWYERIKLMIEQFAEKPLNTGGIARDWSFGKRPSTSAESTSSIVSLGVRSAIVLKSPCHHSASMIIGAAKLTTNQPSGLSSTSNRPPSSIGKGMSR